MNHSFAAQKSKGASGWLNVTSKRFAIEVRDAYRLFSEATMASIRALNDAVPLMPLTDSSAGSIGPEPAAGLAGESYRA